VLLLRQSRTQPHSCEGKVNGQALLRRLVGAQGEAGDELALCQSEGPCKGDGKLRVCPKCWQDAKDHAEKCDCGENAFRDLSCMKCCQNAGACLGRSTAIPVTKKEFEA
jgi:hypothetical protein